MANTIPQSLALTEDSTAELVETYKYLHANPELSMQEHKTADYLAQRLEGPGTGGVPLRRNRRGGRAA